jgi:hypothetical protein
MATPTRRFTLSLSATFAVLLLFPACYTLFQHPLIRSQPEWETFPTGYFRPADRCNECHARDQLWEYIHTAGVDAPANAWDAYYSDPWWFHRFVAGDSARAGDARKAEPR